MTYLTLYPYHQCGGEGCDPFGTLLAFISIGLLVIAAATIALPGLFARVTVRTDRWLRGAAAVWGVIALSLAALTAALMAVELSAGPFEISLPAGWNVVEYARYAERDPAYGVDYTAVLGPVAALPPGHNPTTGPVVGITVIRSGLREHLGPSACQASADGWPFIPSALYGAPVGARGEIALPGGAAYKVVRLPTDGSRIYSWGLPRSRLIGALPLDLCYILVVTVPPDSTMTESDATAIVSAIRFP